MDINFKKPRVATSYQCDLGCVGARAKNQVLFYMRTSSDWTACPVRCLMHSKDACTWLIFRTLPSTSPPSPRRNLEVLGRQSKYFCACIRRELELPKIKILRGFEYDKEEPLPDRLHLQKAMRLPQSRTKPRSFFHEKRFLHCTGR